MALIPSEFIPFLIAVLVVLPPTFFIIKSLLEEVFCLKKYICSFFLFPLEVLLSFAFLPTASVLVFLLVSWLILSKLVCLSHRIIETLARPAGLFCIVFYNILNLIVFCLLSIGLIILLQEANGLYASAR